MGSIETSLEMRQSLAIASWTFNLRDRHFCQLFPNICEVKEIKYIRIFLPNSCDWQEIKQREAEYHSKKASGEQGEQNRDPYGTEPLQVAPNPNGYCNSFFGNVILIFIVVIFAYIVQYLVQSVS